MNGEVVALVMKRTVQTKVVWENGLFGGSLIPCREAQLLHHGRV
jgi:hypothetical protein